jgi:hypothetical protein
MYYLDAKIRSVYRPKCDMSVEKSLILQNVHMAWKVYIPSKCGRSSELCEPNLVTWGILLSTFGRVLSFIIPQE